MSGVTSAYMQEALRVAASARGFTSPNPWVGAVLVRDGRVLAIGATAPPGGPHAEAAALALAPGDGADLYITLEPCVPFPGKRTPSCAERIVAAGVRRVIVAMPDPDPRVAGRGLAFLEGAGVTVEVGDGAEEALALLRPYVKHRQTGLPYVIAKFAASLDGRIATARGDSRWITGERARDVAHRQRAWVDVVMVGAGTVLADDPELTARPGGERCERQPVRLVVDAVGRVPTGARLFTAGGRTMVATTEGSPTNWRGALESAGVEVLVVPSAPGGVDLRALLSELGRRGMLSVWVEGGGQLLGSLVAEGLVDEVWAFLAPLFLGERGLPAVAWEGPHQVSQAPRLRNLEMERLGDDLLVRGYFGPWEPQLPGR